MESREIEMSINDNITLKVGYSESIENEINSSEILKSILGVAPVAFNVWNKNMINFMCNAHIMDAFNVSDSEEFLDRFFEFSPEFQPNGKTSEEMSLINFELALKKGKHVFHWMHITPNGSRIPSEITLIKLDTSPSDVYVAGFIKDLRAEFDYEQNDVSYDFYFTDKLPKSRLMYEMKELSEEWFYTIDLRTGAISFYGKWWFSSFGANAIITESKMFEFGLISEDDIHIYQGMMNDIKSGITKTYEFKLLNDSGEYRYHRINNTFIKNAEDMPVFVMGKGVDIHDQRAIEERSQKDLLTDCYNKISAENIISEKFAKSSGGVHAFFIIDIDNFKAINDNLGHFFGDEVLRDISAGLKVAFRDIDIIARIGGDEFIVFVENMSDMDIISKKAEKILEVYRKTYSGEYKDYSISGSVGIALYPRDGRTYDEIYQNADKALNQAKMQGKNRYMMYSDDFDIGTTRSVTKIENANRIASSFFDYDLISAVFNILYEKNGDSDSINLALSYLCQKYNADRSYIFETLDDGLTLNNTFEYCKEGIGSEIENLQGIPYELFADFLDKAHNDIIYSNNLRETLEQDRAFEIMDDQGILSFVHAQIKRDGKMRFFLGLDDCTKTRVWTEREINSIQYIGKFLSIILQGKHLRDELQELAISNKNSADILDTIESVVYVSDLTNYDLLYLNELGKRTAGLTTDEEYKGEKCYNLLQGKDEPCDFCTNHLLKENGYYEWSHYNPKYNTTYLLKDKLVNYKGNTARLEIATDISNRVELENTITERLEDEKFLMDCVEMLHAGNEPDSSIFSLLEAVTNYFDADRSYIFEVSDCGLFISNTYEYCKPGKQAFKDKLQNLPRSELGVLLDKCESQEAFNMDIHTLDKSSLEYELMKLQDLTDIVIGAIRVEGNEITGFVGVDNALKNKEKSSIIRTVAKFTANFLDETKLLSNLNKLSYYDALTGIKNRHSYGLTIKDIDKDIDSLGVLYADIIGLSSINDANGVLFGDGILINLSKILSEVFEDKVFRVGGDEFVVISENVSEPDFEKDVTLLKEKLAQEADYKVSIGYTWNKNAKNKNKSKDFHDCENYVRILSENLEMEIANGKYLVYLQPQMNLASGKIESAEALVRRVGAGGAVQAPIYFLPFYEKEGIISKIDEFVFETVCKTLKLWKESGAKTLPTISVNCSRMTISKKGVVEKFSQICDSYGIEHAKLVIEMTETINRVDEKALALIIKNFSDAGFAVSLDDFGSGYSNLNSLVVSDFDEIKIDMKIIDGIHIDKKSKLLASLAIGLSEGLDNVSSVAEGVENKQQHELLCDMGCTIGQGYYYAKPMPIEEFYNEYIKK